jgi:hypothetical protein
MRFLNHIVTKKEKQSASGVQGTSEQAGLRGQLGDLGCNFKGRTGTKEQKLV